MHQEEGGRRKQKENRNKKEMIHCRSNERREKREKRRSNQKKQNNHLFTRKSNSSFIFSTLKYTSAFLLPFGFGVDEFLYFIFYVFFNKTKITKILTRKSDSIFCRPKIFYFLSFFVFRLEKHAVACSGEGDEGSRGQGGKGKRLFFASFKQLFFCFLCVCKKKRKRVDLDEVRDRFKDYTRREEGRIVVWIAQNIIPPLCDQVFLCFLSVFFFFFWSFLSSFPPLFFWFLISFPFVCVSFVCVCLLFVCLLFATLNPCLSHLFSSCLFFLSWVS